MEKEVVEKKAILGFLGLGSIGFPMCYGLAKSGYSMVLPTYRRDIDQSMGFSPLAPDEATKTALIDEMLANGAKAATDMVDLVKSSDVILISMPMSKQVELLVLAEDGILKNARPGTIVIDLTSADPMSTQMLSQKLEAKGIDMIDAPVSGGPTGAIAQTLTVMVGGKNEVFKKCLPILNTLGNPDNIFYIGPSGAGDTIKVCNNFLSACCTVATTEAVMVAAKAGIDPKTAIKVISSSGGKSDASMRKYPQKVFPGKNFNFTLGLMCKDVNLFNQTAKAVQVPNFVGNTVFQLWNLPLIEEGANTDCSSIIKMYEKWCDTKVFGIDVE